MLTLDLGNTSASVALVGASGAEQLATLDAGVLDIETLKACLERARDLEDEPRSVAVSAVGAPEEEARVRALLAELGLTVVANPDAGLELRITHPETCGRDRLYAARGAVECLRGEEAPDGVLVVDAGTALTVDAVAITPAGGAFLGGAIAPGPGTLADALTRAGSRLPSFMPTVDAPALGRCTEEALDSGVVVGFRGAVEALCASIAAEAFGGAGRVAVFLTGGARSFAVAGVSAGLDVRPREEPLLVHLGLAAAAREALG